MAVNVSHGEGPIIIVGTGRCGSTMLHRLLAEHERLGWLSTWNEVFSRQTWLSAFSGLYLSPLPRSLKGLRGFPKPFEAYRFWESYLPGFSRRDRPQRPEDVHEPGVEPVRRATASVLRFQRRDRLLVKVTGWSRIAYFDRIYPSARFVSLRRDPRSVVSSWVKAGWLDVTSPPDSESWQWGAVRPEHLDLWRELGGRPVLSVALKMHLDLEDIAENMALFPDRCHELWYEDLITAPENALRDVLEFAGLAWTPQFEAVVRATEFFDSTQTWKRHLAEDDGELVLEFLRRADSLDGGRAKVVSAATHSPQPVSKAPRSGRAAGEKGR